MGQLISEETWSALEVATSGPGVVRTRVAPAAPVDIFVGLEKPSGTLVLLVGIETAEMSESLKVPQARGVEVRLTPAASGASWGSAEVRLTDSRYRDIFLSLSADLVSQMESATSAAHAVVRLNDRLRRWEAFLKVVEPEGLSSERRAGLFGELEILRSQLIPAGLERAVEAWVGPGHAQQDFQGHGWALEVKTSRTKEPISIRISGERQLDDVGLSILCLAHIGLEERRGSGETLPQMVASVRQLLIDTNVAETFEAQLLSAGYLAIHEARYSGEGYSIRFRDLFLVSDGFPRIVEADLPDGVGSISYSVDVSALRGHEMPWAHFLSVIEEHV